MLVGKSALHFRTEISDADIEIYIDGLRDCGLDRISVGFERCIKECEFMPKLRDLFDKMPEVEQKRQIDCGKILKEWKTPYGAGTVAHYYETEKQGVVCRIEKA